MKNKILATSAVTLMILATAAWAAGQSAITGKWTVQDGEYEIKLVFKAEGSVVTGTLDNTQAPGAIEIKDGKIEGDAISFYVERETNGQTVKINWTGTLAGDEIQFKRESAGGFGGGMGGIGGGAGGGMGGFGGGAGGGMGGFGGGGTGGGGGAAEFVADKQEGEKASEGVDGTWLIKDGENEIKLVFKAEGAAVTGTLDNSQVPGAIEIKDGKIEGDKISFHVEREMNGQTFNIPWSGALDGKQIKFKRESAGGGMGGFGGGGGGMTTDLVAKRDKS